MGVIAEASSYVLGSPAWSGFVLACSAVFLGVLFWSVWTSPLPARWKWSLFGLKAIAIGLLCLCLLNPLLTRSRAKPGENIVVLLADQSASMGMETGGSKGTSRTQQAQTLLSSENPWRERLVREFDVRSYAFGSSLKRMEDFAELTSDDSASRLSEALTGVQTRFRRQPLAAILLLTDGNSTDGLPVNLPDWNVPVFPVADLSQRPPVDLSLHNVTSTQTNFEDAPVTVQASVRFSGARPERVVATVEQQVAGVFTEQQSQVLAVDPKNDLVVRFQLKPARPGALLYRLKVRDEAEPSAFATPSSTLEATLKNNQRDLVINRDPHVSRLLYVGGRPNWEHKFLSRALADDPQLQLPSLIRIARKESRFDFRGRAGESSNSLFRGFQSEKDAETEDYSQPVLIRINLHDEKELSQGFPREKANLYDYDGIILDDVESAFFTHDQQVLIEKFVSERGGGLLMLGGIDTFRNGRWERTPVADALPVYLNRPADGPSGPARWQLTKEGWLEPWLRLRETESAETLRFRDAPELSVISPIAQIKPGARLLAELLDGNHHRWPAVVIQQYGQGRSGALLAGDLWKWSLRASETEADDAAQSWRQITRWLVGEVPQRVAVSVLDAAESESGMKLVQVRVRDQEYQPVDERRVIVSVRRPDGTTVDLDAQPSLREAGLFESQIHSNQTGASIATITVTGDQEHPAAIREVGWTSDPTEKEFASIGINQSLLTELAEKTQGKIIAPQQLEQFVETLQHRDLPIMETETVPLWHQPLMLILVLLLLAGEWGLRRWKGLA